MNNKKIVIIGAVAAGSKVAAKVKRDMPDYDVIVYTKDKNVSYSACGMPYYIGNLLENINDLIVRTKEEFEQQGIRIHTLHECLKVNTKNKTVTIKDIVLNDEFEESYDILVLATGSRAFIPQIEGINSKLIFTLRNLDDAQRIKEIAQKSKTVTIIGGGYIGIELIENFRRLGLKVNVIDSAKNIMNIFDEKFSGIIQEHIEKREGGNVKFFLSEEIEKFQQIEETIIATKCKNTGLIQSDFIVISTGIVPNTEFLEGSGIKLGVKNTVVVNENMRTNINDVYACGDCAQKHFLVTGKPAWVALGTTANKEGRVAALNIEGVSEKFSGITAAAVTKFFDFTISCVGLSETAAKNLGFQTISSLIIKQDMPSYMPNATDVYFKLIADRKTHKIIGAQALGSANADKAVNIVSSAILSGITIEKFADVDLTYAPPVSTTIDALITATWNIKDKLKKNA